jgi:hypothetical protein
MRNTASRLAASLTALACHALEKIAVALGCDFIEQALHSWPHRSNDAKCGRGSASEHASPLIDLNDGALVRQKFRIGIVRTEH